MRSSRWVLVVLGAMAIGMTLPALAQSPADAAPVDPAKAASEAPAAPSATSTSPAGVTTASSSATAPANPASAPGVATSTVVTTQAPATLSSTINTTSANTTSAKTPADVLKQARQLGLRPEIFKGVTRYCRTDASLGTRFTSKKCYDEAGLAMLADSIQIEKTDMMRGSDYCPASCYK
jgi:hypothetical protein